MIDPKIMVKTAIVLSLCWGQAFLLTSQVSGKERIALFSNAQLPQTRFAAGEISRAIEAKGDSCVQQGLDKLSTVTGDLRIVLASTAVESRRMATALNVPPLQGAAPQAYALRRKTAGARTTYVVLGADAAGAMYGGLDLAEAIRLGTLAELKDSDHAPRIAQRGIKFNITLDRRTPTYSDNSDSAQANIPEVWDMGFWHQYFDEMARLRFNVLSLWSLHPFPSLVKVPEYPDVALNDVWGNQEKFDLNFNMNSSAMAEPFQLKNVKIVNKMTIDEKIKFWREVMQYAKDRGVDVYWFTWNTFVWGTEGKYGLTEDGNNPTTIEYFRASVRETVRTYPLLAGMGITAGENMKSKQGQFDHEAWLWQTYGEGIRDALKAQPSRKFRLIHRYHQTAQQRHPGCLQGLPRTLRFQLQVLGCAHVLGSPIRRSSAGAGTDAEGHAHLADRAQRRHLQLSAGAIPTLRASTCVTFPGRTGWPASTWARMVTAGAVSSSTGNLRRRASS